MDLGRAIGPSPTGESVIIAQASFRATVPWCVADSDTKADVPVDIHCCVSFVPSMVAQPRPAPLLPGEHPPLLPAAVENHPVWPDAWKASSLESDHSSNMNTDEQDSGVGGLAT
eukprot:COSAG05_NODE_6826_length_896_cov_1.267252_2_plen_113_part_01